RAPQPAHGQRCGVSDRLRRPGSNRPVWPTSPGRGSAGQRLRPACRPGRDPRPACCQARAPARTGSAREPEREADYWLELALGDPIAGRELATNAAVPPRCAAFYAHQAAETAPRPASPTLAPSSSVTAKMRSARDYAPARMSLVRLAHQIYGLSATRTSRVSTRNSAT